MQDIYLELLKKLNDYDQSLDILQSNFKDGMYHLSRANYHNKDSLRGNYGEDYWDNTYEGHFTVNIDSKTNHISIAKKPLPKDNNEIIDQNEEEKSALDERDQKIRNRNIKKKDTNKKSKKEGNKINEKQSNKEEVNHEKKEDNYNKKEIMSGINKKTQEKIHKDTIYMFGGLNIPQSLRSCQTSFKNSIPTLEQLVNSRIEIAKICNELETIEIKNHGDK
ncbi:hypothetical protein TBLA_0A03000 [Henningerozyma blattae CBS 6284]|uniref:Vacuolar ATPase assembly protein VMA22 n=1 Tax=Henningerozyma blattae (strain ATCC 34711 / CBS 6284 / DSM 70876 / NBRC 10599 / NRRL Y-10934 / UCD 77-7) TaxID=1071380 RepID=I2GVE8_HENB6|nr:hypothetical protein TBLA_0A03000 [Tetrapisispora blattae CBS 6284]CCH58100.1 hypothetical protein TBLA_0A03000 [Tetrapisispora blattae CBS 6284]